MWTYATGIYLFALDHGKFRLAAIFGILCGISVLLCGGLIGSWVDRTQRLKGRPLYRFLHFFFCNKIFP